MSEKRRNVSAMVRDVESGEQFTVVRGGVPAAVVISYAEYVELVARSRALGVRND